MDVNSPRTNVEQSSGSSSPLVATETKSPLYDNLMTGGFLPLMRAASESTDTVPVVATLVSNPHPRGMQTEAVSVADLPTRDQTRNYWNNYSETVESAGVLHRSKKKSREQHENYSDDHDDSAESTEKELIPVVKCKKKRGYRKATHTIRKEEIDHLRVELAGLQAQMAELQQRAFAPNCQQDENHRKLYTNVLHNAVKKHQEAFVDIQSALTGYAACNIQAGSPIQRMIFLSKDELSRRKTLQAMKTLKLQDARDFFNRRLSHLNPLKSMSEDYCFENSEGDYWAVRFAISQFEPAKSVKQVFDLVVYYLCNIEISVSEKIGHLTVREDDDNGEEGITQNRLSSLTGKGLRMESNTVVFSEYFGTTGPVDQDGHGLIVAEFVDEDERHPYRPRERIRKDVNTVMEVRSFTRQCPTQFNSGSPQEEKVVVLTRWSHSHLRHPNFPVRTDGWYELRENMDRWSQNMHETIMESLDPPTHCSPTWRI